MKEYPMSHTKANVDSCTRTPSPTGSIYSTDIRKGYVIHEVSAKEQKIA